MKALKLLAVILSSILIPAPALAGIIGTNGISYISAPTTRNYPKADTLQIFEESNEDLKATMYRHYLISPLMATATP